MSLIGRAEEDDDMGPIGRRKGPGGRPGGRRGGRELSMGKRGPPGSRGRQARVDDEDGEGSGV